MRILEGFTTWLATLDAARRLRLAAAVAVAIATAIVASWWAGQETWAPLVSGRGYEAALSAAASVDGAGIPYRITGADALQVPAAQLGAAQAALGASNQLPGLADVSKLQLGLTPQAQEWAFLRAAEGDIARMINGMDGIVASQVHVVPRSDSLYIGEERPASAAVFLALAPGREIQPTTVRAIVNLVASAVDGLDADQVAVADDHGNLLAGSDAESSGPAGEMRSLVTYRAALESRYERSVAQALLPVLGYGGGFSVTATVDVDRTSKETTTRKVEGEKQAIVSEVNEETTDQRSRPTGMPGVDANSPDRAAAAIGSPTGSESTRTANTVNYTYPTVDQVLREPEGGIRRVSVAVQVDSARIAELVTKSAGAMDAGALQKTIDAAVRAAVGFDAERKDLVEVSYLPFAATDWTPGVEPVADSLDRGMELLPYIMALVVVSLVFLFVVRPIVTTVLASVRPPVSAEPVVALIEESTAEPDLAFRLKTLVDTFQPIDAVDLNRLVDREADLAAAVIRKWVTHGQR